MKTPDEIKKGLECCTHGTCIECPYAEDGCASNREMIDSLEYIQQIEKHIGEFTNMVAQLEAAQPKWIPVTERLPNDKEKVVTYKNGIISIQVYEKKRNVWIQDGWFWSMATVTHWMPLPSMEGIE